MQAVDTNLLLVLVVPPIPPMLTRLDLSFSTNQNLCEHRRINRIVILSFHKLLRGHAAASLNIHEVNASGKVGSFKQIISVGAANFYRFEE